MPQDLPRTVLVYRDVLLPKSEIAFMHRQYCGFRALAPVWVGRRVEPWLDREAFRLGPVFSGLSGVLFKTAGLVGQRRALGALAPLCVHAQFGRGGALALPLAEALGLPLFVTFHGSEVDKRSYWRRFPVPSLFRLRLARLQAYASAFVCVSEGVRERLLRRGFPGSKLVAIPIGTDAIAAHPAPAAGRAGILFVGRFAPMKGLPVLAEAISLLRARGCGEKFVFIGDGPERAVLEGLASFGGVELRGWQSQDEVRRAMAAARALCVPSVITASGESEGLPSVAAEALGLGLPVIASSEARLEGVVGEGRSGMFFPARDAAALAARIEGMLALAPPAYAAMVDAAHAVARERLDARVQSARLEALMLERAGLQPG
ncbi:MAG: glycosyltransferase [Acetobacteraceae bacterium]